MDKSLSQFLVTAKKSTYAGASGDSKTILEDGTREFRYDSDGYSYRDRYYGSDPFAGEEVVFAGSQAIWVMNYRGYTVGKIVGEGDIYAFLKQALREITEAAPFRGSSQFADGSYRYKMLFSGDPDSFVGSEEISYLDQKVYELFFHGGLIIH